MTDTQVADDPIERATPLAAFPIPPELAIDEAPPIAAALELVAPDPASPLPGVAEARTAVERWVIEDEAAAEWAMATVAQATDEDHAVTREAKAYRDRISRWEEQRRRPLRNTIALLGAKLESYGAQRRAESKGKLKTLTLPSGSIASRKTQPRLEVADEEKLIAWLEENVTPEEFTACVKVTKSVLLTGLKATLTVDASGDVIYVPTGEVVPDVTSVPEGVSFSVKPS